MNNFDVIANGFTGTMKQERATDVYNRFSRLIDVHSTSEAMELLAFIRELQKTDDYLLEISKGE